MTVRNSLRSGKSTIAKLMLRFWDAGQNPLWKTNTGHAAGSLMDSISQVPRQSYLFNTSFGKYPYREPDATDQEVKSLHWQHKSRRVERRRIYYLILKIEHGYGMNFTEMQAAISVCS